MELRFSKSKVAELCSDFKLARKLLGDVCARKLRARLDDMEMATNLHAMRSLAGGCEELKGDRAGQLSLRLEGGKRLVFAPDHEPIPRKQDGGLDWTRVTKLLILEVEDYHRG